MPTIQEMSDKIKLAHTQIKDDKIELAAPGQTAQKLAQAASAANQAVEALLEQVHILSDTVVLNDPDDEEQAIANTRELNSIAQAAKRFIR